MRRAGRNRSGLLAGVAVLAVLLLHNDAWNRAPATASIFGFPYDIAYHVAWIALASLALRLVVRAAWPRRR